jgi:hypothetical protein
LSTETGPALNGGNPEAGEVAVVGVSVVTQVCLLPEVVEELVPDPIWCSQVPGSYFAKLCGVRMVPKDVRYGFTE